jgi:hypothetical protein
MSGAVLPITRTQPLVASDCALRRHPTDERVGECRVGFPALEKASPSERSSRSNHHSLLACIFSQYLTFAVERRPPPASAYQSDPLTIYG